MTSVIDGLRQRLGDRTGPVVIALGAVFFLGFPFLSPGNVDLATQALLFGLFAMSVDLALGYTGLLTLAPAAFFGTGAYTMAKLVVHYDQSFWLGFPAAVVVAAVLAFPIGYIPIKRRIGLVYFALFTLAFGTIVYDFTYTTTSVTGGSNGLGFFVPPSLFGINLGGQLPYYYFSLLVVGILGFGLYVLVRSDYGDVLHATRQNELRMRYLGYDTDQERMVAWMLSAVVSALAGAVYVGMVGLAAPSLVSFALTGEVIIWVVVGGAGTLTGPLAAAFVLTFLGDILQDIALEWYQLMLGVIFVAFVFLLPEGIMGWLRGGEE